MEEIRYTDLKPGDTIAWKFESSEGKVTRFGVIKSFHAGNISPIGCIETTDGKMVLKEKVEYKIVSDRKIYVKR